MEDLIEILVYIIVYLWNWGVKEEIFESRQYEIYRGLNTEYNNQSSKFARNYLRKLY